MKRHLKHFQNPILHLNKLFFIEPYMKTATYIFTLLFIFTAASPAFAQTHTPRYISMMSKTKGYYEYLPEGYDSTGTATYPLILFMTGIGEFGNGTSNLPNVLKWGVPKEIKNGTFPNSFTVNGQVFRFIVITPQFIKFPRPEANDMDSVLNYIVAHYKVDINRIYITGLSYGGGMCWAYAGANDLFSKRVAAIVPVASPIPDGGDTTIYARSRVIAANNVAVWATHNLRDQDDTVATTISYVNDINQPPAPTPPAKMTLFNASGHNAWDRTYTPSFKENGLNVYEWMLQYQRNNSPANQIPQANAGADQAITLPTNSVTLSGSGTDVDGTITAYSWTKVAGPDGYTIATPNAATTMVTSLVAGSYTFRLTVTDNKGASATDDVNVVVNANPNKPPHADAGPDQTIALPVSEVTLTGSGTDSDGQISSYAWTKVSGPANGVITNPNAATSTVTGLQQGVYIFQLTVTDDKGATASDEVNITVNAGPPGNKPPVADAGPDQTLTLPDNSITLTGTGKDTDGSIAQYLWTKIAGPDAGTITTPDQATTTVTGLAEGSYTFRLTVTDNTGAVAFDDVNIIVNAAPNKAPVATAGTDITLTLPDNSVTLSGSGSDTDGTIAAYEWTKISGPAEGSITESKTAVTTVTGLVVGIYTFRLTVTDNKGATAYDDVVVTVKPAPNLPPQVFAGDDQTILWPVDSVSLNGLAIDADGTIASYAWTKVSGPDGSSIASPGASATVVLGLQKGIYVFRLTVTDNNGATASDDITIYVQAAANKLPQANAGPDQQVTLPDSSITLHGSGTDSDGNIVSYDWVKLSGPAGGDLSSPTTDSTLVTNLQQGTYVYQLTVTDNNGAVATDEVTIDVHVVTSVGDNPALADYRLLVAPNPATTSFTLKLLSPSARPGYLRITDALGRVVEERTNVQRNSTITIGQQYRPGSYYAEVVQEGRRIVAKLLKL